MGAAEDTVNAKDIAARYQEQIRAELETVVPAQGPAASLRSVLHSYSYYFGDAHAII